MKAARIILPLIALAAAVWFLMRGGDEILITEAFAAPTGDGAAAVFMKLENRGSADRLIGVSSPDGEAELYSPEAFSGPPAPVGLGAALAADGAHIRLSGVGDLSDGRLLPVLLTFERAGELAVKARVVVPKEEGAAAEVGLFGSGDICRVSEGEPAPQIALKIDSDGDGWLVTVETEEFTFSAERDGLFHVPGEGHGHLYVGGMKLGRLYEPSKRIGALPKGRHIVRVTLNTNDHRAYVVGDEPVTAAAVITVE